jgi:hypothetical protein
MLHRALRFGWAGFLLLTFALGCNKAADQPPAGQPAAEAEGAVRERFKDLQAAVKAQDADKLWGLLSSQGQADAEQAAADARAAHEQAGPEEKKQQENALGLGGADVAKLTGRGFLKTKRFHRKFEELPDSSVERVTVQGDSATVYFTEPDGDKEKAAFVKEGGQWKASLKMPKGKQP